MINCVRIGDGKPCSVTRIIQCCYIQEDLNVESCPARDQTQFTSLGWAAGQITCLTGLKSLPQNTTKGNQACSYCLCEQFFSFRCL